MLFPPSIFNKRIVTSVRNFFADFDVFLKTYDLTPCKVTEDITDFKVYSWASDDFQIQVTSFFQDGAIKELSVTMYDVPSYSAPKTIRYGNSYTVILHRSYPSQVGLIKVYFKEPHWHPRFSGRSSSACMTPTGEVDRILMDIPFFLMYEQNRVKPQGSDHGVNHLAMDWYLKTGMETVYKELLLLWFKKREAKYKKIYSGLPGQKKVGKMLILD